MFTVRVPQVWIQFLSFFGPLELASLVVLSQLHLMEVCFQQLYFTFGLTIAMLQVKEPSKLCSIGVGSTQSQVLKLARL